LAEDGGVRHPRCAGGGVPRAARGGDVGPAGAGKGGGAVRFRSRRPEPRAHAGFSRPRGRDLGIGARRSPESTEVRLAVYYLPLALLAIAWEAASRLEI